MNTREKAEQAIRTHFPDDAQLISQISDRAWTTYSKLIDQYKGGASASCGWYATIRESMLTNGVGARMAHVLSHIRSDI